MSVSLRNKEINNFIHTATPALPVTALLHIFQAHGSDTSLTRINLGNFARTSGLLGDFQIRSIPHEETV